MTSTADAVLASWPLDPWVVLGVFLAAGLYLRGFGFLRRRSPERWTWWRPAAFLAGLLALFLALASPIEPFSALLLQVHMVQHLLLLMAAPALLWFGWPLFPLLRGLPQAIRVSWALPLFRLKPLRWLIAYLTRPVPALLLLIAATWLWHIPAVYELALRSSGWHYAQHTFFFLAGLVFWFPVVLPYPARSQGSRWLVIPYLIVADVQNTALSALLTFSDQPLYPYYAEMPRLAGMSVLDDQAAAGAFMWVPGSAAFLLPVFVIGLRLLFGAERGQSRETPAPSPQPLSPEAGERGCDHPPLSPVLGGEGLGVRGASAPRRFSLPVVHASPPAASGTGLDVLRIPLLGRFLKWRHARICVQASMLLVAAAVIWDGLRGPQVAAVNLAGVLPWVHWRGLVVFGLLAAGNVFCFSCPFLLPRTIARRYLPASWSWPRWLRSKWLALGLLALFLWAYEAFALWDSPWWTAWIALGYFGGALVVDGLFHGAAFCKHICPIGQFNFVQSLLSPLEVRAKDAAVCAACRTKDCIRGRDGIPGCELRLFLPRKAGNLDCTFCLDCVHACPHDNVALQPVQPGAELWHDRARSSIGRLSRRPDLAALVLLLVFGAFANAAGMVEPVVSWQQQLQAWAGWRSPLPAVTLFYFAALVCLPCVLAGGAAWIGRWWAAAPTGWLQLAVRQSYGLVPLGCAMWLAHYSFHFLTSYDAAALAGQRRALHDLGWLPAPEWSSACCLPTAGWLLRLEILALDLGLLLSLYAAYRLVRAQTGQVPAALRLAVPWAVLALLLFAVGVWILLQPMQMRGTLQMAG